MTIMSDSAGEAAVQVLTEHALVSRIGVCRCGWDDAGHTHAQHVLHEMQMAGLDVVWR